MNITRVYGRVAEKKGDSNARIEVLAYRSGVEIQQDPLDLKQTFPPLGYVFSPFLFDKIPDLQIGELIEFNTMPSRNDSGDANILDLNKDPKLTGIRVFQINQNILNNERSIDQPLLKDIIKEDIAHFYISQAPWIYGPFKMQTKEIVPRSGMTVRRSALPKLYRSANKHFLLFEPKDEKNVEIDCMTQAQLINFLKDLIKANKMAEEIAPLKRALETIPSDDLGKARLTRISSGLDKITLNLSELSEMARMSDDFQKTYWNALENAREELRNEYLSEVSVEKISMEKELTTIKQDLQKTKKEKERYEKELSQLQKDHAHFSSDMNRMLQDFRINSQIVSAGSVHSSRRLATWEEQVYESDGATHTDLSAFIRSIASCFPTEEQAAIGPSLHFLYHLKDHRCLLVEDLPAVLSILRLTRNCRIVIQQVEADWLKFEHLYNNSLQYIWESAHQQPSLIHFLILEDINLAGMECYGKPLLDILEGIRFKIPGCSTAWPENLWILGNFLPLDHEQGMGLPLSRKTFQRFGYIPFAVKLDMSGLHSDHSKLLPEALVNHNKIPAITINPHLS